MESGSQDKSQCPREVHQGAGSLGVRGVSAVESTEQQAMEFAYSMPQVLEDQVPRGQGEPQLQA